MSSTTGSNVRENQPAFHVAGAGREEGAAELQGKQECSAELPCLLQPEIKQ